MKPQEYSGFVYDMICFSPQIAWWMADLRMCESELERQMWNAAIGVKFCNWDHYKQTQGWWLAKRS